MKNKFVDIQKEEDCPADELMRLYRKQPEKLSRHIFFSKTSIDFFKSQADDYIKNDRIITFFWEPIPEEGLPSLKVKLEKKGKQYQLIYLKEKVTFQERQEEFKGRVTLTINQSTLRKKAKQGNLVLRKKSNDNRREER